MERFVEMYKEGIQGLLPANCSYERFRALMLTLEMEQPQVVDCLKTDRGKLSLLIALRRCATLGLEVGPHMQEAWILPFKSKGETLAQLIIGNMGYKTQFDNANVGRIKTEIIYDTDDVTYQPFGADVELVVKRDLKQPIGQPIAYAMKADYKGKEYVKVLTRKEVIDRHMQFSKAKDSGPWVEHFDSMALGALYREAKRDLPREMWEKIQPLERAQVDDLTAEERTVTRFIADDETRDGAIETEGTDVSGDHPDHLPSRTVTPTQPATTAEQSFDSSQSNLVDLIEWLWESALPGKGAGAEGRRRMILRVVYGGDGSLDHLQTLGADPLSAGAQAAMHLVEQQPPRELDTDNKIEGWYSKQYAQFRQQHAS